MAIVGFNFSKIKANKEKAVSGKVNINNNISLKKVEEAKLDINKAQKALKIEYEFSSKYEPEAGSIEIEGSMTLIEESGKADEILAEWKKSKKLPKEVMTDVLNTALTKCNIQALIMSQQISLPPPIQMPKVEAK